MVLSRRVQNNEIFAQTCAAVDSLLEKATELDYSMSFLSQLRSYIRGRDLLYKVKTYAHHFPGRKERHEVNINTCSKLKHSTPFFIILTAVVAVKFSHTTLCLFHQGSENTHPLGIKLTLGAAINKVL